MPRQFDIIVSIHCRVEVDEDATTEAALRDTTSSIQDALAAVADHGFSHPLLPEAELTVCKVLAAGSERKEP